MTETSTSMSINQPSAQTELFRPSLHYPMHPYAEMLTRTAERYPENEAVLFSAPIRLANDASASLLKDAAATPLARLDSVSAAAQGVRFAQARRKEKETNLSYRELDALVNAFANALLDLGIHKGQKVCLFMANRAEYLISWFAITRIGAVVSPINPSYKEREVAYQLSNSESVAVVVQHGLLPLVEAVRAQLPTLKYVITVGSGQHTTFSFSHLVCAHPPTLPTGLELAWEDAIALPYSSGTTGLPKGVLLSHKNLVCNAYQSIATARITAQDRMLVFVPLYHIYGIMLMGLAAMTGATIVLMERFEPERCLQLIQEQRITLLYSVPQVLAVLSDWPQLNEYDLHTVRFTQCGAAPVPPALARRFEERTHITVMTSYGLTEASPGTHSNPVYDPRLIKVETIGLPGPQVMQGYWRAPEATAEALRNGWLYTGDIGWRDEEGYVTITDRKKELIKVKGFSVAPAQIEALLLEHPAVVDVAVIAKPHEEAGEVPKAFVVLRVGHEHVSAAELLAWANGKLATFKNVREIEFIDTIPRNPSGKILRRVLKQQEQQRMGLS